MRALETRACAEVVVKVRARAGWMLIRSPGAAAGAKQITTRCGATVTTRATGVCDYCGGTATGEFDEVLSRIEQD